MIKRKKGKKGNDQGPSMMILGCASLMLMVAATTTNGSLLAMTLAMLLMASGAAIGAFITYLWKAIGAYKNKKRHNDKNGKNNGEGD